MKPGINIARRACEAAGARQVVVVFFDASGQYSVASYGTTRAECAAVRPVCEAIFDAIGNGLLPGPGAAEPKEADRG